MTTTCVPLKGQLIVLIPQPECNYGTSGGIRTQSAEPGMGIHMMPRSDGVILGGTSERDVWTLDVNEKERLRVVKRPHRAVHVDGGTRGPEVLRYLKP